MEKSLNTQIALIDLLKRFIENYKKDGADRRTHTYYQKRLIDFQELYNKFTSNHLETLILKASLASNSPLLQHKYFEEDMYSEMDTFFMDNYAAIHERFQREFPPPPTLPQVNNDKITITPYQSREGLIKLPKIYLEKFSVDYRKWSTFHDLFKTMIHENKTLSPVQKLQYLKLHLVGEPENLLRHFQVTNSNYDAAWNLFIDRYDNKRVLINAQLKTLLSQSSVSSETAQGIKNLLDTTTECLQALTNLEIDTSNWDAIIVYIITQKLPSETHELWEQGISKSKQIPSWNELQEFLEARFRTLEAVTQRKISSSKDCRFHNVKPKNPNQSFHVTAKMTCNLCSDNHNIRQCPKFSSLSPSEKLNVVKVKGLCINCLGQGHMIANCPSQQRCLSCKQRHHSLLHRNADIRYRNPNSLKWNPDQSGTVVRENQHRIPSAQATSSVTSPSNLSPTASKFTPQQSTSTSCNLNSLIVNEEPQTHHILLATAIVKLVSPSGKEQVFRALVDPGSQVSLVTETVVQALQLKGESVRANISGVGQTDAGQINARVHFTLKSLFNEDLSVDMSALVLRRLTHLLPSTRIFVGDWKADPSYYQPAKIDILLGADVFGHIIMNGIIKGNEGTPIAQETTLGWILSGKIESREKTITMNSFHVTTDLDEQLRQFWEMEEISVEKQWTEEEKRCEDIFQRTHTRRTDGRYVVELPFCTENAFEKLGNSRGRAVARLHQMETRFKGNPDLKAEYSKCLQEYILLDHMELVIPEREHMTNESPITLISCYLPHHSVTKEDSTTTKLRVVFDASSRTSSGTSLNDILLKGPTIQDELSSLLLRWRRFPVAFTADLEKMYRQIRVIKPHAEFQRIVWRQSSETPIQDYRLQTVTFGTKSAPYLATRTLKQLALDEQERFPMGSAAALTEFYVDDLLSGADTIELAIEKSSQIRDLMQAGGFQLRKWASNSSIFLEGIPKGLRESQSALNINISDKVKALGLYWNPHNDSLSYTIKFGDNNKILTKRTILSDVSKLFDPLGWLSPIIIIAKMMIQKLWLAQIDWDDAIPENLAAEWLKYRNESSHITEIHIPRWIYLSGSSTNIEIHGFSDASMQAYAAVVYICSINENGERTVALLTAKTKVAPIKTVSLPKLELCGAALLAKLVNYVIRSLKLTSPTQTFAWTDSEIVLAWLKGHPAKWKSFIANRVSFIHETLKNTPWRHVPSKENPADCATRGMYPNDLKSHMLWWNGPKWLHNSKTFWPSKHEIRPTELEARRILSHYVNVHIENEMVERFSSLSKLVRTIAYCKRFFNNAKVPEAARDKGYLKAMEIKESLQVLVKRVQTQYFAEEIHCLTKNSIINTRSRLIKLTPFIDNEGFLRVGGRLRHANIAFDEKHPIILPDKSHLTRLIIEKGHRETLHGGAQLMMNYIGKKFWILNARSTIRCIIHKCITCYKQKMATQQQLMGDLPIPRVRMSRPFSHTGVDYCGPFEIKRHKGRGAKLYKGYLAIFVCMATKALHIEIVTDLTSQGFIAAFRRFVSRRGLCSDLYSDCGSNFVGANTILTRYKQQMADELNSDVASILETEGVTFHFIPPSSPHMGGLWESDVRSTKYHMKRIIGNSRLTYEELSTVIAQIEACLNSRPLCPISSDPNDLTPLTPAHFLIGDILITPPEPSLLNINMHRLDRWQYLQQLYQSFWKRWYTEYLSRLQQRPKWTKLCNNLEVGRLVIIKEDNIPPSRWMLGRIIETHPGTDNLVRVVTVQTQNAIFKRPVTKICLLPIETLNESRGTPTVSEETKD